MNKTQLIESNARLRQQIMRLQSRIGHLEQIIADQRSALALYKSESNGQLTLDLLPTTRKR